MIRRKTREWSCQFFHHRAHHNPSGQRCFIAHDSNATRSGIQPRRFIAPTVLSRRRSHSTWDRDCQPSGFRYFYQQTQPHVIGGGGKDVDFRNGKGEDKEHLQTQLHCCSHPSSSLENLDACLMQPILAAAPHILFAIVVNSSTMNPSRSLERTFLRRYGEIEHCCSESSPPPSPPSPPADRGMSSTSRRSSLPSAQTLERVLLSPTQPTTTASGANKQQCCCASKGRQAFKAAMGRAVISLLTAGRHSNTVDNWRGSGGRRGLSMLGLGNLTRDNKTRQRPAFILGDDDRHDLICAALRLGLLPLAPDTRRKEQDDDGLVHTYRECLWKCLQRSSDRNSVSGGGLIADRSGSDHRFGGGSDNVDRGDDDAPSSSPPSLSVSSVLSSSDALGDFLKLIEGLNASWRSEQQEEEEGEKADRICATAEKQCSSTTSATSSASSSFSALIAGMSATQLLFGQLEVSKILAGEVSRLVAQQRDVAVSRRERGEDESIVAHAKRRNSEPLNDRHHHQRVVVTVLTPSDVTELLCYSVRTLCAIDCALSSSPTLRLEGIEKIDCDFLVLSCLSSVQSALILLNQRFVGQTSNAIQGGGGGGGGGDASLHTTSGSSGGFASVLSFRNALSPMDVIALAKCSLALHSVLSRGLSPSSAEGEDDEGSAIAANASLISNVKEMALGLFRHSLHPSHPASALVLAVERQLYAFYKQQLQIADYHEAKRRRKADFGGRSGLSVAGGGGDGGGDGLQSSASTAAVVGAGGQGLTTRIAKKAQSFLSDMATNIMGGGSSAGGGHINAFIHVPTANRTVRLGRKSQNGSPEVVVALRKFIFVPPLIGTADPLCPSPPLLFHQALCQLCVVPAVAEKRFLLWGTDVASAPTTAQHSSTSSSSATRGTRSHASPSSLDASQRAALLLFLCAMSNVGTASEAMLMITSPLPTTAPTTAANALSSQGRVDAVNSSSSPHSVPMLSLLLADSCRRGRAKVSSLMQPFHQGERGSGEALDELRMLFLAAYRYVSTMGDGGSGEVRAFLSFVCSAAPASALTQAPLIRGSSSSSSSSLRCTLLARSLVLECMIVYLYAAQRDAWNNQTRPMGGAVITRARGHGANDDGLVEVTSILAEAALKDIGDCAPAANNDENRAVPILISSSLQKVLFQGQQLSSIASLWLVNEAEKEVTERRRDREIRNRLARTLFRTASDLYALLVAKEIAAATNAVTAGGIDGLRVSAVRASLPFLSRQLLIFVYHAIRMVSSSSTPSQSAADVDGGADEAARIALVSKALALTTRVLKEEQAARKAQHEASTSPSSSSSISSLSSSSHIHFSGPDQRGFARWLLDYARTKG